MTRPLCAFANWFSVEVGNELTDARRLGHPWRETTWTDRMLRGLRALRDPRIVVKASNEAVTAADMDWWFVDRASRTHIGLALQAKILHYHRQNSALWAFDELAHPRTAPGAQARKLLGYVAGARRTGAMIYPLYLFYNCDQGVPPDTFYPPHCAGVNWANGHAIARHIRRNLVGKSFPAPAKRFTTLSPLMMPLTFLLCTLDSGGMPRPTDIAALLTFDRERLARTAAELDIDLRAVPRPQIGAGIPDAVERILARAGRDSDDDDQAGRSTVVFVSGE